MVNQLGRCHCRSLPARRLMHHVQERGVRLRCNLPDTLVLRDGQPAAWFATNKVGGCGGQP